MTRFPACSFLVLAALLSGPTISADEPDPIRHVVSPPLRQLVTLPIPSTPMDAAQLKGLLETTNLWAGLGGPCADKTRNELNVAFDPKARRWMIGKSVDDLRCTAVSVTDDATGSYDLFAFVGASVLACDAACQAGFITEHNRVRTRVNAGLMPAPAGGVQPIPAPPLAALSWDATIASGSQAWADGCTHTHSGVPGLGENLYYSAGSVPTPATAVASWESESTSYTYAEIGNPVNNFVDIGHYTQLVWASTNAVGCGVTHCTSNTPFPGFPEWDFIVCRYSPAGNFTGQFPYTAAIACSNDAACNDGNICTNDVCNSPGTPASNCAHTNNAGACNDGNTCTGPDACAPPPSCGTTQNFDGVAAPALPSGWTSSVTGTGNPWTTVNATSDTAPNSAFGFDGAAIADQVLVSPAIAIVSSSATLTFKNRWSFEDASSCFDAGVLEIKIGAGAFTDIVTAGGSFVVGGYTGTVSNAWGNPLGGRAAWCNASAGYPAYITTTVNLPAAAAGQTIQFRWRVGTDSSSGAAGQNFDSIVVGDFCPAVCVGANNNATCDDGNACTGGDVCSGGACSGTPIAAPPATTNLVVAADKATYSWSPASFATRYDVVRGSTSAFPVGPGGGDEVCFNNLPGPSLIDATTPAMSGGFWYLSRGDNSCGSGTYGTQGVNGAPGVPRVTTTCP